MIKAAFIVNSLKAGGIEMYLLRFLTYTKDRIEATVICKSGLTGDLHQDYLDTGAKILPIKLGYLSPKGIRSFYHTFKNSHFDVVCDFSGNFAGIPLYLAYQSGIEKRISFYRGSDDHFKRDRLRLLYNSFVRKLVLRYATKILSNSKTALDFFYPKRDLNDSRFEVIYNGINTDFTSVAGNLRGTLNIPENAFVVGHVGRYNRAKNHDTIIKVAIAMCLKNKNIYFVLCGDGVDGALSEMVSSNGLEKQIKLLGYRRDVIHVLNTMDCFYFPSVSEGQPNALIEALIAGLPFVASNISPIKEVVPEEYYSQLVPPADHESAIEKILEIYHGKRPDLSVWAKEYFHADFWFSKFYNNLVQ